MERIKKTKQTLDSIFFVTPEQKLFRFLLSESTTAFSPRVLSSKLKGVRGLGGTEGINRILKQLADLGLVLFIDNNRKICVHNDHIAVRIMKTFSSMCDLEDVQGMVEPISTTGILIGSRATGLARSDSEYDLYVVSNQQEEVRNLVSRHPLGKRINLMMKTPDDHLNIHKGDPRLAKEVEQGYVLWGSTW